jgi:hypothetical protein
MQGLQQGMDPVKAARTPWRNLALLFASLLVSAALIELSFRVAFGLPLAKWADWRTEQVVMSRYGARTARDPVLGWTNLPWINSDGIQTLDEGIRRNFDETALRAGAVLAVGDSFTEGWEVADAETWPAALEGMAGVPVVNAGIGAYAADQIMLRAEQLLPIVKPRVLIVGLTEDDIARVLYTVYGTPKLSFTLEDRELVYHPPGPLEPQPPGKLASLGFALRDGLGHLAAADYVLARLAPDYWYSTESMAFEYRTDVDDVAVACALLGRLKAQADRDDIRMAILMQYTAQGILMTAHRTREAQGVIACAQDMDIRVVDGFPSLYDVAFSNRAALQEYYHYDNGYYGHMSAAGNRLTAELLWSVLADWLSDLSDADQAEPSPPPVAQVPHRLSITERVRGRTCCGP